MNNLLTVFRERGQFYKGKRVLIMETGEDLGKHAAELNLQFAKSILNNNIDSFIGYRDAAIKNLVSKLSSDNRLDTGFYTDLGDLKRYIEELPEDSLVMIKSSDGRKYGSDLWTLPTLFTKASK